MYINSQQLGYRSNAHHNTAHWQWFQYAAALHNYKHGD